MKRKILWILGLLAISAVLLLLVLHAPFVRAKALKYVQQYLAQHYNTSLSAQSLDYNLLTLRVTFKKPVVRIADKPETPPFFQADEITFRLTTALLRGKALDFKEIRLTNARVDISNIPPELLQKSDEPAPALIIRRIVVENARVLYKDPESGIDVDIPGISLRGAVAEKQNQRLELRVDVRLDDTEAGKVTYGGKGIKLQKAAITLLPENKDARFSLTGTELTTDEAVNMSGRVLWGENHFLIPSFQIAAAGGEISGNADLYPEEGKQPNRLALRWKSLDLQSKTLTSLFPHPIFSTISGTLDLESPGLSFGETHGRAGLDFKPAVLKPPRPKDERFPLGGHVSLQMEPGKVVIPGFNLSTVINNAAVNVHGSSHWNFGGTGDFGMELRGGFKGDPPIEGDLRLSGQRMETAGDAFFKVRMESGNIRIGDGIALEPTGDFTYRDNSLETENLAIRLMGGEVEISGTLPLGDIGDIKTTGTRRASSMDIKIKAKNIHLEQMIRDLRWNVPVKGTLSLDARLRPGRTEADLHITNPIYVYGIEIEKEIEKEKEKEMEIDPGDLECRVEITGDRVEYRIRAAAPELPVEIEGSGSLAPPYPFSGSARFHIPDLEKLSKRRGFDFLEDIAGNIGGKADFRLDLADAGKTAEAKITIDKFLVYAGGKELESSEPIRLSYTAAGAAVESMKLKGPGSLIELNGRLPLESPAAKEDDTGGLSLRAEIDARLLDPFTGPLSFNGSLAIQSRVSGSLDRPVLSSLLTLKDITIVGPNPLHTGSPDDPAARFNARIEGTVKTGGSLQDIRELSADAQFTTLQLQLPGFPSFRLPPDLPAKLRLTEGKLMLEQVTVTDENQWNRFTLSGSVPLAGTLPLDIGITGSWDARIAGLFLEDIELSGKNAVDIRVTGSIGEPGISGFLDIQNNEIRYPDLDLFVHQLNGRVRFTPGPPARIRLEGVSGYLNGGTMTLEGDAVLDENGSGGPGKAEIKITTEKSRFEFPAGLNSEASGSVVFSTDGRDHRVKGTVEITGAVYREPFNVMSQLFDYLGSKDAMLLPGEENSVLDQLNLDIRLLAVSPVSVSNNLSRSELTGDLTLKGTVSHPTLSGRVNIKEGGEIYLANNTYSIESGIIHFINPYRIEPDLRVRARTKVGQYDIRLDINGTPDTLKAVFTSTPALSEPNIISLLATGRTLETASASLLDTTGSQALAYINNSLSGTLQRTIKQTLGIETVRFDGSLIALKEDPGARLTIGQSLTSNLKLTLSQNLKQSQNRTWILDYRPFTSFKLQGIKRDREQYAAAVQYETRFRLRHSPKETGKEAKEQAAIKKKKPGTVSSVEFTGDTGFPVQKLQGIPGLKKGKPFDYFKFHGDMERLRTLYRENHYLRAEIRPERHEENGTISLHYNITAGPRIYLDFQGDSLPRGLREKAAQWWIDGRFDRQSTKNVVQSIRRYYFKKGFYRADVIPGTRVVEGDVIRYPFTFRRGLKFNGAIIGFKGNGSISRKRLLQFLKTNGLRETVFEQPGRVSRELTNYYRGRGFLSARVGEPEILYFPPERNVTVTFPVEEGPRFRVRSVTVSGNRFMESDVIVKASGIKKDSAYLPAAVKEGVYLITAAYGQKGFTNAHIIPQTDISKEEGLVDISYRVEENQRGVIRTIDIKGNDLTRVSVIRRELTFKEGDTVNFQEVNKSRRKLYDLGIFERVNIEAVPMEVEGETDLPYRVEVQLTEMKPYRFNTGLQWNSDSGFGGAVEMDNTNIAGRGHYLGAGFSIDGKETNSRVYYRFPYFMGMKIATEGFVFANRKEEEAFTVERRGFTLQQQYRPSKSMFFSWNYTWERTWTDGLPLRLAHFTAAFTVDRRDSLLNPTRGFFLSGGLQYAARFLGSDAVFSRYFGEFHFYKPLVKTFLVSATSLQLGLGYGLGKENLPAERFYAGGGSTLRGFKRNSVGPLDAETGVPLGGEALFIFKQELRVRFHRMFSVVLFTDIGNVYDVVSQFDLFDVRKSAGFGLRLHTDPLLLRFDWGFNLDRRPGEPASRVFFSIGQSF